MLRVQPLALKGARFLCVCIGYMGGWRSPIGEVMDMVEHSGDEEEHHSRALPGESRYLLNCGF